MKMNNEVDEKCFITFVFEGKNSTNVARTIHNASPLQIAAVAKWLDVLAGSMLLEAEMQQREQQEANKLTVPDKPKIHLPNQ